jgi:hypothetical protein
MEAMVESAIMQGNRNVLVKQKMLNFALAHPSDLISGVTCGCATMTWQTNGSR